MLLFVLNGLAFMLIGLQLPSIIERLADRPMGDLLGLAAIVCATVIVVRLVGVFLGVALLPKLGMRRRERSGRDWRSTFVIGWAGMRGVVSLAAALSIPLFVGGAPFPERDLLIFLAFAVILVTLVGQGLTLPLVIRALGLGDDGTSDHEEVHAREAAVRAGLRRLETIAGEWPDHGELIDHLRAQYEHRLRHLEDPHTTEPSDEAEKELLEHRVIRREVIDAEREAIIQMRDRGAISDEVLRRVERDIDLEEVRLEA